MERGKMTKFDELVKLNVNDKTEKRKDGNTELTYLSWAWAWSYFKKQYPEATYEIVKFKNQNGEIVPYMYDEKTGYMVNTYISADGLNYEMWLPVMDSKNKAMKSEPYTYKTKFNGEKTVEAATMFDINKTIMRCLVKNMAMFGLGLYIYAGEDLPEQEEDLPHGQEPLSLVEIKEVINTPVNKKTNETDVFPATDSEENTNVEQNILFLINNCETEEELQNIFKNYKREILADDSLLSKITKRGNVLKKGAA